MNLDAWFVGMSARTRKWVELYFGAEALVEQARKCPECDARWWAECRGTLQVERSRCPACGVALPTFGMLGAVAQADGAT